ncbi:MAG: peptidylprolyl isomerase [Thermoanaerobaculia bacterium]|nr:peptidylprolyl isomerase [Thermoanaerobaculia bacterium]
MDVADLVRAGDPVRREMKLRQWLPAPALHMLALGAGLFAALELRGGAFLAQKPRVEIPAHRFEQMVTEFRADTGRGPTREEWAQMLDLLVDDEILFQYALALGLHENSAAQSRLAQIAEFVEANPHGHEPSPAELAGAAMELGLHEGDLVVRRILVDSARRLIRGVVLLQQPTPELVEQYYAAHAADFTSPARIRLSQVAINGFVHSDSAARAERLLARIQAQKLGLDAALALADETPAPVHLGLQNQQSLAGEFGSDFAATVMTLRPGGGFTVVPSDYGHHLVWIHEYEAARVPPLEAVRDAVTGALLQKLADDWLRLRLRELRGEFDIVLPPGVS